MTGLSTGDAFAAYEAARHRLPPPGRQGGCERGGDLGEIAGRFDAFLLDAFGVLNIGETAIPGVAERVEALRAAGKRVLVLTNAASAPLSAVIAKYARLGYAFPADDVISSRDVALAALRREPPRHWGVMASERLGRQDLEGISLTYLGEDPAPYRDVEAFFLLGSGEWTEARQCLLEAALAERSRPVWVGNPDLVAPREGGFSVEPGQFAHRLAERTGVAPRFFGKPFSDIFETAFARLGAGIDRARVLMVGDSLHTDILGAQAAGIASALVAGYGFFAGYPVEDAIATAGIRPDYILERP